MRRTVIYTQRVEIMESYHERRDCTDQNIPLFLVACGFIPIPIPNVILDLSAFVKAVNPVGVLLTGGNSLVKYGGNAPERDEMERQLIEIAMKNKIPIYGFCRGMQIILDYFGCVLENVQGHVALRHRVDGKWGSMETNSYHNQACKVIKAPLRITARAEDGVIEAADYPEKNIIVTMWHPEREVPFKDSDIARVKKLFDGGETERV